jgi:heavy metal sensor kinase
LLRYQETYETADGLRIYVRTLLGPRGQAVGALQAVESLGVAYGDFADFLTLMLVTSPILLAVATVGGIFLAGRALQPIDRLTRLAGEISAGNLRQRLGPTRQRDEVGRLAATFDTMLDRLEQAFHQQRQFVADASHELRTPLTIIRGDLDVLLRRARTPDEYAEALRNWREEITRLSQLAEDLLTLAQADSGHAVRAFELINLDDVVEESAAGARRLAQDRGVQLEVMLEQRPLPIVGDPILLRQLVFNLMDNAVKYTPRGGRVAVWLTAQSTVATLMVADTGTGIASQDLPHIFDRFFRADEARSRHQGGSGLGLAIARWSAEAHGGTITVQSQVGKGSTFTVVLPLAREGQEENGKPDIPTAPRDTSVAS